MNEKHKTRCPVERGAENELLVAYAAHQLSPEEEAQFTRHLDSCARCRDLADAQRAVWIALEGWASEEVSPDFDERLFRRIAKDQPAPWWRRLPLNWPWRPALPVAVACAALIAAFLVKDPVPRTAPQSQKPQIEQVEHALDDIEMLKQLGIEKL